MTTPWHEPTYEELQAQIDDLQFQLDELTARSPGMVASYRRVLDLDPQGCRLLHFITRRPQATWDQMYIALYGSVSEHEQPLTNIVSVYLSKIRKALKPFGLQILSARGVGVHFPPEDIARLKQLVENGGASAEKSN